MIIQPSDSVREEDMEALPPLELDPFPEIDLRHMLVLTDGTGMLQHATHTTPNPQHGYCTDDNARALIAGVMFFALRPEVRSEGSAPEELTVAMQRYLGFLSYAFDPENGRFRNFMNYARSWREEVGSEDSHARALWSFGVAFRLGHTEGIRNHARDLFEKAVPAVRGFRYVKPWAYSLLGISEYVLGEGDGGEAEALLDMLSSRLLETWKRNRSGGWPWWEDRLTWGNAKLPHALLVAGNRLKNAEMTEAALESLAWLQEVQTGADGCLSVIGNQGWYRKGSERARFDQQPIEAKAAVQACIAAARITREERWVREAERSFEWFLGRNDSGIAMYDRETGGCRDGLGPDKGAANEGAESTLAYVLSVLELHHYARACLTSKTLGP